MSRKGKDRFKLYIMYVYNLYKKLHLPLLYKNLQ